MEFAALVHKKFVFIHPFIDGNGRLARLLMNLSLLRNEYTITIIPAILRNEYINSLEIAHKDDTRFRNFIADRVISTQLDLLRLLKESGGVNKADGGVNTKAENAGGGVTAFEDQIIELLQNTPGLNAPAIATLTGKGLRTIQRYIKKLSVQKKIIFKGAPKTGGYFIQ